MRTGPRLSRATALVATVALTIGLVGCGSGDSSDSGDSKELTYWSLWQEKEPQAKVLKETIESFQKDTGITVNVEWQGRDNMTKVLAALHSGDVPDLVDNQHFTVKSVLVANDQFTDLGAVYEEKIPGEDKTVRDVVPAKYDAFTTADGKQFMVPMEVLGYSLWYDGKRLPGVTKQPPQTWQDFTSVLAKQRAAGREPIALDGDIAGYGEYWLATALIRTLGPGGLRKLVTQKDASGWADPKVRTAVSNIASLAAKKYFASGYMSSKWPAVQNKWAQGKSDFLFMGSWTPTETGPLATKGFDYRSVNFPTMGEDKTVPASVIGFAIPKPAEHADAARKFIAYFMAKDRLSLISTTADNLTDRKSVV